MAKKKKPFVLGKDVEAALAQIVSINEGEPRPVPAPAAAHAEAEAAAAPAAPAAPAALPALDGMVMAWYRAMKPRPMPKFAWLVMLHWLARRTDGRISIDETSELLGQKRDNVARALNELAKAGWINVTDTEKGARGKVIAKKIEFVNK